MKKKCNIESLDAKKLMNNNDKNRKDRKANQHKKGRGRRPLIKTGQQTLQTIETQTMQANLWQKIKNNGYLLQEDNYSTFTRSEYCVSTAPSVSYLCYRIVCAIAFLIWTVSTFAVYPSKSKTDCFWCQKQYMFTYLSYWGLILLTIDNLLQCGIIMYARKYCADGISARFHKICIASWRLETVNNSIAPLISIGFWGFLQSEEPLRPSAFLVHLSNIVYVLVNQLVTARPVCRAHCAYPLLYGLVYLIFNFGYYACGLLSISGKPYIYEPLDWSKPGKCFGFAFASAIIMVAAHFLHFGLYRFRCSFLKPRVASIIHMLGSSPSFEEQPETSAVLRQASRRISHTNEKDNLECALPLVHKKNIGGVMVETSVL